MATLLYTGTLVVTSCWCGIKMAIPEDLFDLAQRKRHDVYCPLGHTFVYGDPEYDRLKREAKIARDQAASARARADQVEASLRTTKGHVTRLRRRVLEEGACPICGQTLRDLARHVKRVHSEEPVEVVE